MTTPETAPEAPTPTASTKKPRNTLGLVALGIAILGALFAVIPATNGISWVILLGAFVVSLVAVTRKGKGKAASVIALIVSILFWIISIPIGLAVIGTAVSDSINEGQSITTPDEATDEVEESGAAGIGDTITNDDGVEVTLISITPDATSPDDFFTSEVRGTLVAVSMTMTNGSDEAVTITGSSVKGFIGEAEYEAARVYGTDSGDWYALEQINPGLTAAFTAYIDVPEGTDLDTVSYTTDMFFGDGLVFLAK